jgi:putative tryptophan/tyrosine transport system substrate-binding protein
MRDRSVAALPVAIAFLIGLGWTGESWAQAKIARVGILATAPSDVTDDVIAEFYEPCRRMLAQEGWIEGKTIALEYRNARGNPPQFAEAVAELVKLRVDVIYADSAPATRAAYAATRTIPIVGLDFTNDPVAAGYAESYGRPGRNLTGFFLDAPEFASKWLELLKATLPGLSRVAVLWDPSPGATHLSAIKDAAKTLSVQLQILEVRKLNEIDEAFPAFRPRTQALIILPSPMTWAQSARLAELSTKHRLPGVSMADLFAEAGGLLSYGPDPVAASERGAVLVAKILAGAKPGVLPVERPTKFKFIVNLKTAKALGLTVPESILVSADKVIR